VMLFARGVEGVRVAVDIGKIVSEVEAIVDSAFPKNIELVTSMSVGLDKVMGDATQLNQVLLNLCVNARDAMPSGGQITISARNLDADELYAASHSGATARRYVILEVADSGTGIPREILDRIFEPFFTTKDFGQGTGLGLSTVQGIVRSHGGFVEVSSQAGKGSLFRVHLPAYADALATVVEEKASEDLPRGSGELILVVDDEPAILNITRQTLEEFGYAVLTAEDGAHAIAVYASTDRVALVLTDIMMPVMDGGALIAALRRISPGLPIIAASGHTEPEQLERITSAGQIRFLAKPYSAEEMLKTLFQMLASASVPAA
jgi:two-component system cell cycle sensor histidine kinase/response regulator CckA